MCATAYTAALNREGECRCENSCAASVAIAIAALTTRASAAEKWDMASGFPDNNFHTKNIQEFIAKVKQGTKELDIVLHSNQALFKLQDSKKAVQSGQVPIAELLLVQFGNEDPIYEISAIPFLADTIDKARSSGPSVAAR